MTTPKRGRRTPDEREHQHRTGRGRRRRHEDGAHARRRSRHRLLRRAAGATREAVDRRELADAPTHTELRHDPLLDQWVVVAGHRQARTFLPPSSECPLCPTRGDQLTEVPEADYEVVVFENRFPSLTMHDPDPTTVYDDQTRHGFGRCEVVCFTSEHGSSLANVPAERIGLVLEAWIDRTLELSRIPGSSPSSSSRTAASRSASPCRIRTARSMPTRSCRHATS